MPGFKLYDVPGYDRPLRLSAEHAATLDGREVSEPDENRPARNASKAAWVEYAEAQGATDADAQTRAQLIETYG